LHESPNDPCCARCQRSKTSSSRRPLERRLARISHQEATADVPIAQRHLRAWLGGRVLHLNTGLRAMSLAETPERKGLCRRQSQGQRNRLRAEWCEDWECQRQLAWPVCGRCVGGDLVL